MPDDPIAQSRPGSSPVTVFPVPRKLIAGLVGGSLIILLGMLVSPARSFIERIDAAWSSVMVDLEVSVLVDASQVLATIGTAVVTVPARVAVAAYLVLRRRWRSFWFWVLAMAGTDLVVGVLKALFGRDRPDAALDSARNSAFPSGHSAIAIAIGLAVVILAAPSRERWRLWFCVAVAFGIAMALSRTYLRVHWMSDVVAGLTIGAAISLGAAWAVQQAARVREGRSRGDPPTRS
ncbi:MAG: phosphatase PAP2 family protein [Acidimicrobiia bacterium]